MAASKKPRPRTTCTVALDKEHRWVDPPPPKLRDQLPIGFSICSACGAVLWKSSGYIEYGVRK